MPTGLSAFVSAEQNVGGWTHAPLGSLAVLTRNGAIQRVVLPGEAFRRGLRAPLLGSLKVVLVNTGLVGVTLTVAKIPTRDSFTVASVKVEAQVTLNRHDGYAAFVELAKRQGVTFAQGLLAEMNNALDQHVRRCVGSLTHDQLFGAPLAGVLHATQVPVPIGAGLLVLEQIVGRDVVYDPHYEAGRGSAAREWAVQQETKVRVALEQQAAEALAARIEAHSSLAARLGVPAELLADPRRRERIEAQSFELARLMLEPGNRALLARSPDLLAAVQAVLTAGTTSVQPAAGDARAPSGEFVVADGAPPTALRHGTLASPLLSQPLTVDRRLQRAWLVAYPNVVPEGIAGAVRGGRGAVVVVAPRVVPVEGLHQVQDALGRRLGVSECSVAVIPSDPVEDFMALWVSHADPADGAGVSVVSWRETVEGEDVVSVRLRSDGDEALALVRHLEDPDNPMSEALESLLACDRLEIRVGDH